MSEDKNFDIQEAEQQISKYLNLSEVQSQILNANKTNATRINLDINHLREWDPVLTKHLIHYPLKLIPIFEKNLNEILDNFKGEKVQTNTSIQEKKRSNKSKFSRNVRTTFSITKRINSRINKSICRCTRNCNTYITSKTKINIFITLL